VPASVPESTSSVPQISVAHDIIAIKNAAGLVAAQFHGHALRNARSDHVADGGPAEVVRDAAGAASGGPSSPPRVEVTIVHVTVDARTHSTRCLGLRLARLSQGDSIAIRIERRHAHPKWIILGFLVGELNAARAEHVEVLPQVVGFDDQRPWNRDLRRSGCFRTSGNSGPQEDLLASLDSDREKSALRAWVVSTLLESECFRVEIKRLVLVGDKQRHVHEPGEHVHSPFACAALLLRRLRSA
jgi:hypothetical protein